MKLLFFALALPESALFTLPGASIEKKQAQSIEGIFNIG
jgi:hypothetical protein